MFAQPKPDRRKAHTPGPWSTGPDCIVRDPDGAIVCSVFENGLAVDRANARLIALAPEMLETLRKVLAWLDADCDPSRATIANARRILARYTDNQ